LCPPCRRESHSLHHDAAHNCCPADIVINLTMNGDVLFMDEVQVPPVVCTCNCCYDVEATGIDLPPGMNAVQYYWDNYDAPGDACHIEQVTIP